MSILPIYIKGQGLGQAEGHGMKQLTKPTKPLTVKQRKVLATKADHPELTTRQIGKLADCSHVSVINTLDKYGIKNEEVKLFRKDRSNILDGMQSRLLASVTDEDIKKAPLGTRILAACQLYDKSRIEAGKSVDNIMLVLDSVQQIRAMQASKVA
jgi:hypothetical protein